MKEITTVFDHYRISARSIWNTAFWPDPDFRDWDSIDQFHEIDKILFNELVLAKVDREWPSCDLFVNAIPFFQVAPSIAHGTPIMIQNPRPGKPTGYWDDPVNLIKPPQAELQFIAYFDWNQMDYIDLRYATRRNLSDQRIAFARPVFQWRFPTHRMSFWCLRFGMLRDFVREGNSGGEDLLRIQMSTYGREYQHSCSSHTIGFTGSEIGNDNTNSAADFSHELQSIFLCI